LVFAQKNGIIFSAKLKGEEGAYMASTFEKMIQDFSKKDTTKLLEKEKW
jgi:hypothetical protein